MTTSTERLENIVIFLWWLWTKLIKVLAVLVTIWILLSWWDVIDDNLTANPQPLQEGNFFVEVMEIMK